MSDRDRQIVRDLAKTYAEHAAEPENDRKRAMWTKLNRLEKVRPMVWINELPHGEFEEVEEDLHLTCEDQVCRSVEKNVRWRIYEWEKLRCDRVLDSTWYVPKAFENSGYGLDRVTTDSAGGDYGFGSCDYIPIMKTEEDIKRIRTPEITPNPEKTERDYQHVSDLIGDIIPVEKRGVPHMWCAPWDVLIQWWGITELMMDMVDRPEFVNAGVSHMMDVLLAQLDQLEEHGLLAVSDGNHRVGSGGLGITDELPGPENVPDHVGPEHQWGTSTGQIFSEVSPDMHWEFCLKHEMRWLERFGLNCYGCCEPLHNKMGILRKVPRLRRISMSTWINVEKAAAELQSDYVFSYKPNPSVLAWDTWSPDAARDELRRVLDRTRGCVVELIMKDVSTCRKDPRRVSEWCALAVEVAEEYN